jgi:hypothetical protein
MNNDFSEISSLHSDQGNAQQPQQTRNPNTGDANILKVIEELEQFEGVQDGNSDLDAPDIKKNPPGPSNANGLVDKANSANQRVLDDKDARRLVIAYELKTKIEEIEARQPKEGYEEQLGVVVALEPVKVVLYVFMVAVLLLAKPAWCQDMGKSISYNCVDVLDPNNRVRVIKTGFLVLSPTTKNFVCLFAMAFIAALNLCKAGFSVSNKQERSSATVCLVLAVAYFGLSLAHYLGSLQSRTLDLCPVFFLVVGIAKLRRTSLLFTATLARSRFVFLFAALFVLFCSAVFFLLFREYDDFKDSRNGGFFDFDFSTFSSSLVTLTLTLFRDFNIAGIINYLNWSSPFYLTLYGLVAFVLRFFVQSILLGVLYYFYSRIFKDNLLDMRVKHPLLEDRITKMVREDRHSARDVSQALYDFTTPSAHKDSILEIENFHRKTQLNFFQMEDPSNPESVLETLRVFSKGLPKQYAMAAVDMAVLVGLLVSVESEKSISFAIYGLFLAVGFVQMSLAVAALASKTTPNCSFGEVAELLSCLASSLLILLSLISADNAVFVQMITLNPSFRKAIGLLVALRTTHLMKLLLKFGQVKYTVRLLQTAVGFISELLLTAFIIIFVYASIGIVLFGGQVHSNTIHALNLFYQSEMPTNYQHLNFNDYYYACLTLFTSTFSGVATPLKVNTIESKDFSVVPLFFFLSFFFLIQVCLLNILLGFIIDGLSSYLKQKRLDFAEAKHLESEGLNGGPREGGQARGVSRSEPNNELDGSRLSESLDVYLELKKKQSKGHNGQLHTIREEQQEDLFEDQDQPPKELPKQHELLGKNNTEEAKNSKMRSQQSLNLQNKNDQDAVVAIDPTVADFKKKKTAF